MKAIRLYLVFAVSFLAYTTIDILLWQRIFERNELWVFIPDYKTAWNTIMFSFMAVVSLALWDVKSSIWFCLAFFFSAWGGTEDVLYYVLDGREIPQYFHWLEGNTRLFGYDRISVIASAIFWQLFNLLMLFIKEKI